MSPRPDPDEPRQQSLPPQPPPQPPQPQLHMTWLDEWHDFWAFVRRPRLAPRCRQIKPGSAWLLDWRLQISPLRLLGWAAVLWGINLFLFGPIVMSVAKQAGAEHAVDPTNLPWLLALVWAPLVEEMLFRYGLRRPLIALWLVPLMILALLLGPGMGQTIVFALTAFAVYRVTCVNPMPSVRSRIWLRAYRRWFWLVFHLSVLLFAMLHLFNFSFAAAQWWMLPLLILPQWFTGLVLGWIRVMRGIGAAMVLHALFNFGPLFSAWLAMRWLQSAGLV